MARIVDFLTLATRGFHPTWLLAFLATGCLQVGSACAVYCHELVLIPKFRDRMHREIFKFFTFLSFTPITIIVVLLIQTLYDIFWGPDPARFGFVQNVLYDYVWISLHVIGAELWRGWLLRVERRKLKSSRGPV